MILQINLVQSRVFLAPN